jgi:hypothetical protein
VDGATPKELEFDRVHTLALSEEHKDLVAGLYYEPTQAVCFSLLSQIFSQAQKPQAPVISLTGAGSDRPKEIAQARAKATPELKEGITTDEFKLFLRLAVGVENPLRKRTNKLGSDAVQNYRDFDPFFSKFEIFAFKPGYLIPPSPYSFLYVV